MPKRCCIDFDKTWITYCRRKAKFQVAQMKRNAVEK